MQYTLDLIRTIQSSTSGKFFIFAVLKDDSNSLTKYLNENGVTAESLSGVVQLAEEQKLIGEFKSGNISCLITDSPVHALAGRIEHIIYFSYKGSSYAMHLSNMSYSSIEGKSHGILSNTDHNAAKSIIEQFKCENQHITAEVLKLANQEVGHVENLQSQGKIQTTLVESSDKSVTQLQNTIKAPIIRMNDNSATGIKSNIDARNFHSDVQRICRQQVYIMKKSWSKILYTLKLICGIQSWSTGKILVFTVKRNDTVKLVNFLNRGGVPADSFIGNVSSGELQRHVKSLKTGCNSCFVTTDENVEALADDYEHVIHFSYNDSNYGRRLKHMSYSSTGGISHVILNETEHFAAKSMIKQLKYGNQEIPADLLQLANIIPGHLDKIQFKNISTKPSTSTASDDVDGKKDKPFAKLLSLVNIPTKQHPSNFIKCTKDIYSDHVDVIVRTTTKVEAYRLKNNIVVGGDIVAPNPIERFEELKEIPVLPLLLRERGHPTPMQSQAWPIIMSGHDMIGLTRNGDDRTLSYMLPVILHIQKQTRIQPYEGPIVLILTPSRDLGRNILKTLDMFRTNIKIRRALLHNEPNELKLRKYFKNGFDMVIAVPEIALALIRSSNMNLKFCSMVIVDDVDAQMAATNGEVLREILKHAPAGHQTLWFSQSWFATAQQLAMEHMPNGYCSVDAGKFHRDVQRTCRQQVHILKEPECRMQFTLELIRKIQSSSSGKILIFTALKDDSISLTKYLKEEGVTAGYLNDVCQEEAQERAEEFKNGKTSCLITLDSPVQALADDIEHVIHYSYNSANYGMRLSHMSYSSTGGTSHAILYDTEHGAAKSMIEQLKYGNQVRAAKLMIEQLKQGNQAITAALPQQAIKEDGHLEKIQSKEEIRTTMVESSHKSETQPVEAPFPQSTIEAPITKDGQKISTKDIYSDHVDVIVRTTTEVEAYRLKNNIVVGGDIVAPNPIERFEELKEIPVLPLLLRERGHPTPMQSQAWPIIMSGHDMIGLTKNGDERTLSYMLPAILHIQKQRRIQPNEGPVVLILSQCKEGCMDIFRVFGLFRLFRPELRIRTVQLIEKDKYQGRRRLNKGIDMVIAVPEIALRLLSLNFLNLKFCSMVIVDNVDAQMVATNGKILREILKFVPPGRQTLWFSQSWFAVAQQLAIEHMPNGYCSVDTRKLHSDVHRICRQQVYVLEKSWSKMLYTLKLICGIQSWSTGKILIFTVSRNDTLKLVNFLNRGGVAADSFIGNVNSEELQRHVKSLKTGCNSCVVTTDLKVEALADDYEHVIHFSYNDSNYGRRLKHMSYSSTGGISHVILNDTEHVAAKSMIKQLQYGNQEITAELLKLANQEAGHVVEIQSKEEIEATMLKSSVKSGNQPVEPQIPQSTIKAPVIEDSNNSKIEKNCFTPNTSAASGDADARERILMSKDNKFAKPLNLINIPTKQHSTDFIKFTKDIYSDHVSVIVRTTTEVEAYRQKNNIVVGGAIVAPNPIERFEQWKGIPLLPLLLRERGHPTPMQSQAWPIIMSGHDMIGLTKNGDDRTLSYMLPAILHIHKQTPIQPYEGPIVLILTPSRDLGRNILKILDMFRTNIQIRRAFLTNEPNKLNLRKHFKNGFDMVIAVPEIALALIRSSNMNLKFCSMVIVDDVDAQIIATSGEVLKEILKCVPAGSQRLWFSQSWFAAAQQLAIEHMPNGYCSVDVGKFHRDVQRICSQQVHILKESDWRIQYTLELIRKIRSSSCGKILIFALLEDDSISLAKYLKEEGVTAEYLNDVVDQKELQDLIEEFRTRKTTCLITLDSAVQALSLVADGIEHVIHYSYNSSNYGMRLSYMSYASTGGTSHVILYNTDHDAAKSMIEHLKYGNQEITSELQKLANQEVGHLEKIHSKEEILTTMVKANDTPLLKILPKSTTIKAPKINLNDKSAIQILNNKVRDSKSSQNENNITKPSTSAARIDFDARYRIATSINKQFEKPSEKSLNLVNLPTKQQPCNFIKCKKDIYRDHVAATVRTTAEVQVYRQQFYIIVGGDILAPDPITSFDELKEIPYLPKLLTAHIRPNPMQSQAWPIILSGYDMIGLTRKGHERALAYILPAILHIQKQTKLQLNAGPIVLVLTQSKDLAINIYQTLELFRIRKHIRTLFTTDLHALNQLCLRKGVDMVIAVAEIALELLRLNIMNLKCCSMVIVDDVDAQMAATNGDVLREILNHAPAGRQTLWFSQSWFAAAQQLATEHMPNGYCSVDVGKFHRDVQRICRQQVYILKESECRMQFTLELMRKIQSSSSEKILIFTELEDDSIRLAKYLKGEGVTAGSLNDVVSHEELQDLIAAFKTGNKTCLITMDSTVQTLADDIKHVIHYSYNSSNYGMRLSHMSYSSTGGTSHVILYDTDHGAAKSMIEQLKYGSREISAELLHLAGYAEKVQSKREVQPTMVELSDKSKTQPLKEISTSKIKVILTSDSKRQTLQDISVKTVESKKTKISIPIIDYSTVIKTATAGAKKPIQIVKETQQFSNTKKRKNENITQPLSSDKWIGANDVLRRILIEEAKKKTRLAANTALPDTGTKSNKNTNCSVSIPSIHTTVTAHSTTTNYENSLQGSSKNIIRNTNTAKRFRYEDLYGVSDDSE